jgi:glyoxylase I family protein
MLGTKEKDGKGPCTRPIPPRLGGGAIIKGMGLVGLHHVSINVDDVNAAIGFYVDVLGLKVRPDRPDFSFGGAWLDAGGQQVHLIEATPPPGLGQHFALAFSDLPGLVDALRDQGFEVTDPVRSGTSLQSFLDDPAGNRVELHQPGVFAA